MRIHKNYPLKKLTTFKIGGRASYFCAPRTFGQLLKALEKAHQTKKEIYFLGGGSNVLFSDGEVDKFILWTKKMRRRSIQKDGDSVLVTVEAGLTIDRLSKYLYRRKISGLEFAGGLPGTIGGAVYMNARCNGGQFSDVVKSVFVVDKETGQSFTLSGDELEFSYKSSVFMKNPEYIICRVELNLKKGDRADIKALYRKNKAERVEKGQYEYPSAGCIFKNDHSLGVSSGKIIDDLGLKGKTIGGAQVYDNHANFIINKKNASSEDVIQLIKYIEKELAEKKNITLQREVQIVT